MRSIVRLVGAALLGIGLSVNVAFADPINGSISIAGGWTPNTGNIATATAINFVGGFTVTAPAPTLDLAGFAGASGAITSFSFAPFPAGGVVPLWTTTVGPNTLSFDLTSISVDLQNAAFLVISGSGIMHLTGFQDTVATFAFTGQTAGGGTFSWSASDNAVSRVPEPSSIALIGLALAAFGFARRRMRS